MSNDKLDWTAPLMLDDGKGTGVEVVEGPDDEGDYLVRGYGFYRPDGSPFFIHHPRIINRPNAEPVERLPADEGLAEQKRPFEETQSAFDVIADTVTVPRMTEAEVREHIARYAYCGDSYHPHRSFVEGATLALMDLLPDLIRPDTPLDRFTASHPNWRDLPVEEAVRLALEGRDAT